MDGVQVRATSSNSEADFHPCMVPTEDPTMRGTGMQSGSSAHLLPSTPIHGYFTRSPDQVQ